MLYKINEIGDEGLSLKVPLSADWLKAECPDLDARVAPEGLTFRGRLQRSGDDVFLNGSLTGGLECVCSRCLEAARLSLQLPVHVTFVPGSEDDGDDDDADKDAGVMHFDGDQIDLAPELREQILLAIPISPLCRDNCAGLCSVCGGNRNRTACDCLARQAPAPTRLGAALGKLKM
jgi:uncharacterized protein